MKTRISIQVSKAVLAKVDLIAGPKRSRSAAIERILSQFLLDRKKDTLQTRDLQQINREASRLNLEAAEVLEYQSIEENPEDIEDRHVAEARLKKRGRTYTTAQVRSKLGLDNGKRNSRERAEGGFMYIHMFAFRFKAGVTDEQKDRIVAAIRKLRDEIPGILETWVGRNDSPRGQGYELGGVMKFADKAACEAYGAHPVHQKLLSWLMPLIEPIEVDFNV